MKSWQTDQATKDRTWGVIGKLHFQISQNQPLFLLGVKQPLQISFSLSPSESQLQKLAAPFECLSFLAGLVCHVSRKWKQFSKQVREKSGNQKKGREKGRKGREWKVRGEKEKGKRKEKWKRREKEGKEKGKIEGMGKVGRRIKLVDTLYPK